MQKETSNEWPTDKKYGICRLSLMTLYQEPVLGSGITTQLLFGETYTVTGSSRLFDWLLVRGDFLVGTGWIPIHQHEEISESDYLRYVQGDFKMTLSPVTTVRFRENDIHLLTGSILHISATELFEHEESTKNSGEFRDFSSKASREELVKIALRFVNAPFLSGGRSLFGLDMGAMVQLIFKLSGYIVPNYLSELLVAGKKTSSSAIKDGDLIFFSNSNMIPCHLAIYLGNGQLLELKGKVTTRSFDPNEEMKNNSPKNQVYGIINLFPA